MPAQPKQKAQHAGRNPHALDRVAIRLRLTTRKDHNWCTSYPFFVLLKTRRPKDVRVPATSNAHGRFRLSRKCIRDVPLLCLENFGGGHLEFSNFINTLNQDPCMVLCVTLNSQLRGPIADTATSSLTSGQRTYHGPRTYCPIIKTVNGKRYAWCRAPLRFGTLRILTIRRGPMICDPLTDSLPLQWFRKVLAQIEDPARAMWPYP
ncbi:hypothetical protein V8E53_012973 [Lactarius tabidus]|jgi:hypothetical protein